MPPKFEHSETDIATQIQSLQHGVGAGVGVGGGVVLDG